VSFTEAWLLFGALLIWGVLIGTCLTLVIQRFCNPKPGKRRRQE
jgi:hypothetical protein